MQTINIHCKGKEVNVKTPSNMSTLEAFEAVTAALQVLNQMLDDENAENEKLIAERGSQKPEENATLVQIPAEQLEELAGEEE